MPRTANHKRNKENDLMAVKTGSKLALLGGEPVREPDKKWPAWPVFDDKERQALNHVLESGEWFNGPRVAAFQEEYAAFQDAKHCIACNSGTAGLEIALEALGVGHGDEVIVPPFTFIATASSVARLGAYPVFVDVDETWNLDPGLVEQAITPRTKAIIPVHFAGCVCDMDRLNAIGVSHGIPVIEDACHSWGGKWKGKGTGALGTCGVFSFQMSKNITAGEGGALLTGDDALAERCRSISNCGRTAGGAWYEHPNVGTNARMTEFQAALLSAQLTRLEEQTLAREKNGAYLNERLAGVDGLTVQPNDERITRRAYHLYCLRIDPGVFGCTRERFCEAAKAEGLPIGPGYPLPLYKQPCFRALEGGPDYDQVHCPVTEDLCNTSAMWTVHQLLLGTEEDMADFVAIVEKVKANAKALSG